MPPAFLAPRPDHSAACRIFPAVQPGQFATTTALCIIGPDSAYFQRIGQWSNVEEITAVANFFSGIKPSWIQ